MGIWHGCVNLGMTGKHHENILHMAVNNITYEYFMGCDQNTGHDIWYCNSIFFWSWLSRKMDDHIWFHPFLSPLRVWELPFQSQIPPYWHWVKSGISTGLNMKNSKDPPIVRNYADHVPQGRWFLHLQQISRKSQQQIAWIIWEENMYLSLHSLNQFCSLWLCRYYPPWAPFVL